MLGIVQAQRDRFVQRIQDMVSHQPKTNRPTLLTPTPPHSIPGAPEIELTYNWGGEEFAPPSRSMGHLAFATDDIYGLCEKLRAAGHVIHRPPRDGKMAFVKSPDGISVELLQKGVPLEPAEPWSSMENTGEW